MRDSIGDWTTGILQILAVVAIGVSVKAAFADESDCYIKVYKNSTGVYLEQGVGGNWCTDGPCPGEGAFCQLHMNFDEGLTGYWCSCSASPGSCALTFQSNGGHQTYGVAVCVSKCPTGKQCPPGASVTWHDTQWVGIQQADPCPPCQ